jgi:myo-inositol-1(or 4)-monophosphatase
MGTTLEFASQLALKAGELLADFYQEHDSHAKVKIDQSLVTEADKAADRLISRSIQESYPQDVLLSEEINPVLSSEVYNPVWIIDPLDGTTNFFLGLPIWGVSIARLVNGIPEIAVLNFPLLGELYHAQFDQGAHLNNEPIQVKPPNPNQPAAFFSCCSRTHRRYSITVPYKTRILGSAAYGLCSVARGSAVLGFEATPKIWDIAAAWLLVNEAGGVIESYAGANPFPLIPGTDYSRRNFPTLAAPNQELITVARSQISPK